MPLCYMMAFDQELTTKIKIYRDIEQTSYPCAVAITLLEVLYTTEEAAEWRLNTINYCNGNFELFKKLCAESLPKLFFYDMEASYLCLVDFKDYGLEGEALKIYNYRPGAPAKWLSSLPVDHASYLPIVSGR